MEEPAGPAPDSVRERLEQPTRLLVTADTSDVAITAERKVGPTWETGEVDLGIDNGELIVWATRDGKLAIEGFQVAFAPIDLPEGILDGHHAQLTNVRVDLVDAKEAAATWTGDDEVHLEARLALQLTWQLSIDGSPAPLGSPALPPVPVELVLTGDGAHVEAELRAQAPGELWSWAGVIKLRDLTLALGASL